MSQLTDQEEGTSQGQHRTDGGGFARLVDGDRRRQKAREKAQKKGQTPTARHLATCDWTVYITSCDETLLSWQEVIVLYRMRWQIELLFKLWKSHNLLEQHRSEDPVRQLTELYAKLTGVIIQHWLVLTTCWPDAGCMSAFDFMFLHRFSDVR